jgi:hypothetical protein
MNAYVATTYLCLYFTHEERLDLVKLWKEACRAVSISLSSTPEERYLFSRTMMCVFLGKEGREQRWATVRFNRFEPRG